MDSELYFKEFGDSNCVIRENNQDVIQINQKTNFTVKLGLKEEIKKGFKLDQSLISGELFYDSGSANVESTQKVKDVLSVNVMDLVTTPVVEPDGGSVEFQIKIFILTDLEDQFFRIKFTLIDRSQENCRESIWSPLVQVIPRKLKSKKKRKISTIAESEPKISKKDLTQVQKNIQKEITDQNQILQQIMFDLQKQSQQIVETRDLTTGCFIDGRMGGAVRQVINTLEQKTDEEMLQVLNNLKLGNQLELIRLHRLLERVLEQDSAKLPFVDSIGIDPKLLHLI